MNIDPTRDGSNFARAQVWDYLGIKSNAEFDINVRADTSLHTDENNDGIVDMAYSGKNPDPNKPVKTLRIRPEELGPHATGNLPVRLTASDQLLWGNIPAGTYLGNNNQGLSIKIMFDDTDSYSLTPAGFYKIRIIWTFSPSN